MEHDAVSSERYIKGLPKVCWEMFRATGAMVEQVHLGLNMFAAAGNGGASAGNVNYHKGIMEHKVIQNLIAVNGDKSCFKQ